MWIMLLINLALAVMVLWAASFAIGGLIGLIIKAVRPIVSRLH